MKPLPAESDRLFRRMRNHTDGEILTGAAAERRLVYRRGEPFSLLTADHRPRQDPAFTVRVAFADNDGNGSFDFGGDELYGVHFERVAGIPWLEGAERDRR